MDKQIQSWTYLALSNGQKTNILTQNHFEARSNQNK